MIMNVNPDSIVHVRDLAIGDGTPKIIIPLVGKTDAELTAQARRVRKEPGVDAVEWRVDFYEYAKDKERVLGTLGSINEALGKIPLLFTFRTKKEGGMLPITKRQYFAMNLAVAKSGKADLIDVETFTSDDVADHIAQLHKYGVKVIGSKHDFGKTPTDEEMTYFLERAWEIGADIPKLAVMPQSHEDVLRLLGVTMDLHDKHDGKPTITMSMSNQGVASRIYGEVFGSAMTFGALGQASAPGQVPAQALRWALGRLHTTREEQEKDQPFE